VAESRPHVTSSVAEVEVSLAVRRRGLAGGEQRARDVLADVSLIACDGRVIASAAAVEPSTLRALDAIHLATALSVQDDLHAFVTYDRRLAEAGRAAGLEVVSPE
jgi:predicted nucleic acid-binding protein